MVEYKEIDVNKKIPFTRMTKKYGIAYFDFCFEINEEGKIEKVFITPSQQPDKKHGWFIKSGVSTGYFIEMKHERYSELVFRNIHVFYCKFHKSISISVATPEGTSQLWCDHIGGDIWFRFE